MYFTGEIYAMVVHNDLMAWRRQWHPTPVLLPGKSHRWRSLVGWTLWGREELDMTECLHFHFSLSCTGEGNGNPLQCSCLENPRDGEAWWAVVYGVAQSRTRLKWFSSIKAILGISMCPHSQRRCISRVPTLRTELHCEVLGHKAKFLVLRRCSGL